MFERIAGVDANAARFPISIVLVRVSFAMVIVEAVRCVAQVFGRLKFGLLF